MTWNYRVVRHLDAINEGKEEYYYQIHEAYYDEGKEEPHSITEEASEPMGETPYEVEFDLLRMLEALDKPVLEYEKFSHT